MSIIFELKSRKGGAKKFEIDKIGEPCWIDYQKDAKPGSKIKFKILKYEEEYGQPYLKKQLIGEVMNESKLNKKKTIAKYKSKKRYKVKKGHRQQYTLVKITGAENIE